VPLTAPLPLFLALKYAPTAVETDRSLPALLMGVRCRRSRRRVRFDGVSSQMLAYGWGTGLPPYAKRLRMGWSPVRELRVAASVLHVLHQGCRLRDDDRWRFRATLRSSSVGAKESVTTKTRGFQPTAVDPRRDGLLRTDSDYANGCAVIALCPLMCGRDWCLAFGTSAY